MKLLFFSLFLLITLNFQAQTQIGQDIDGEDPNDRCGYKITSSEDGNRIAISYQNTYTDSNDTGKVKIFDWNGSDWVETGALLSDTTDDFAYDLGADIKLSNNGNRLAIGFVGAVNANGSLAQGKVEVYQWINNIWQQIGDSIVGGFSDGTGFSLALSGDGNVLAVPAYRFSNVGKVNTFVWDESTANWLEFGNNLFELSVTNSENFGQSVDLSNDGSYMVVGAPASTEFGDNSGAAFYYERNIGESRWDRIDFFTGGQTDQNLGWNVAISGVGNRFAYSSSGFVPNGDAGSIVVYDYINNIITPVGNPIVGGSTTESTGISMDLSSDGNKLIYGSPFEPTENFGRVVGKMWNGSIWETLGNPIPGENNDDRFGLATTISGNGERFIGGTIYNSEQAIESGHVRVFEISTLSISDKEEQFTMDVYPNPTSQFVFLVYSDVMFSKVRIYDVSGRLLGTEQVRENKIDLKTYPIGMLILEFQHDNTLYKKKIIKF